MAETCSQLTELSLQCLELDLRKLMLNKCINSVDQQRGLASALHHTLNLKTLRIYDCEINGVLSMVSDWLTGLELCFTEERYMVKFVRRHPLLKILKCVVEYSSFDGCTWPPNMKRTSDGDVVPQCFECCSVDRLPDECIIKIFDYLQLHERIYISATCTRWRVLVELSWPSIRDLDLARYIHGPDIEDVDTVLIKALPRVGPYLHSLQKSDERRIRLIPTQIRFMSETCSQLTELSLRCVDLSDESFFQFRHFSSLRKLVLNNCINSVDHEMGLASALQQLTHLKTLRIHNTNAVVGVLLSMVPETLTTFQLWSVNIQQRCLVNFLSRHSLLKVFKTSVFTNDVLNTLADSCRQLETLSLCPVKLCVKFGINFASFRCLRVLDVNDCDGFCNDDLVSVCDGCPQLSILRMRDTVVTNVGLRHVTRLSHLRRLDVGLLPINDDTLALIVETIGSSLERLRLYSCKHLTKRSLNSIENNCSKLRLLDLSKCNFATMDAECSTIAGRMRHNCCRVRVQNWYENDSDSE